MNDENNKHLNLNSLPDDFSSRDYGKQAQFEAGSSSSGQISRKKKKKKDDESGKVYECRFCSLKFCKSQALGGHMNRHRPERETETLNKARMLVFSSESSNSTVHGLPAHHLGLSIHGGFHQAVGDPTLHFRPAYPVQPVSMRVPASTPSSTVLQLQHNPPQSYLYHSPPRPHSVSYPSRYHPSTDYYVGHVLGTTGPDTTNYTCIGPNSFGGVTANGASVHTSVSNGNHDDESSWGMRGFGVTSHKQLQPTRLDLSLAINRFQDRF